MGARQSSPTANPAATGRTRAYSGSDLPSSTSSSNGSNVSRTTAGGGRHHAYIAPGASGPSSSSGQPHAARARSVGGSGSRPQSGINIPNSSGAYSSQDSGSSSPEEADRERSGGGHEGGHGGPRLVIGSLPAHLSPHLFGDQKFVPVPVSDSPASPLITPRTESPPPSLMVCLPDTPPSSPPPSSPMEPEQPVGTEEEDSPAFVKYMRIGVLHLVNGVMARYNKEICFGCQTDHPSQTCHPCLEPSVWFYEVHYKALMKRLWNNNFRHAMWMFLHAYEMETDCDRIVGAAEMLLNELRMTGTVAETISEMYDSMVGDDVQLHAALKKLGQWHERGFVLRVVHEDNEESCDEGTETDDGGETDIDV